MKLVDIMDDLREKCPWDRKQTIESLRPMTIEETYELAGAITEKDWQGIREELGDLLLHVLFYARIGSESGAFDLKEVIGGISEKLIRRHPHIYGDATVKDENDVKRNWEQIKLKEGKGKSSVLEGVPKALPALMKAHRIQEKAKQVGFEWDNKEDVWKKVEEEIDELKEAVDEGDRRHIDEEFGDVLFTLVNYARFSGIDPESALEATNQKFMRRFKGMEALARERGTDLATMDLAQMDLLWNEVKKKTAAP